MDWTSLHNTLETTIGIHNHETRTIFILINTLFLTIQFVTIISIVISVIRFHRKQKEIDRLRVARLAELDSTIETESQKLDHVSAQLSAIEQAILVCHELHRQK